MSWIKLHEKIREWRWWNDPLTVAVFVHILISANWKDKEWKKTVIPRGSFVTSLGSLAEECGVSVKQLRRILKDLQDTGETASKGTNKYTIITVCKYDTYQCVDNDEGQAKGQTKGKQRANKGQQLQNNRIIDNNISLSTHAREDEGLTPEERELIFDIFFYKFGTRASDELERFADHYGSQGWRKARGARITDRVMLSKSWVSKSNEKGGIPDEFLKCLRLAARKIGEPTSPLTKILAVRVDDQELHIVARESDGVFPYIEEHGRIIGACIRKSYKQKIIYNPINQ